MTAILALTAALILAGVATFTFFGGYWWQVWKGDTPGEPTDSESAE